MREWIIRLCLNFEYRCYMAQAYLLENSGDKRAASDFRCLAYRIEGKLTLLDINHAR